MKSDPFSHKCLPMVYRQHWTPRDYICSKCGATRVKLWRDDTVLYCVRHAVNLAGFGISDIDKRGEHFNPILKRATNWIGDLQPAVPSQLYLDGKVYLYLRDKELSGRGLKWWQTLPLKR